MSGSQALDYELGWRRLLDPGRTASKAVVAQVHCAACVLGLGLLALGYSATALHAASRQFVGDAPSVSPLTRHAHAPCDRRPDLQWGSW